MSDSLKTTDGHLTVKGRETIAKSFIAGINAARVARSVGVSSRTIKQYYAAFQEKGADATMGDLIALSIGGAIDPYSRRVQNKTSQQTPDEQTTEVSAAVPITLPRLSFLEAPLPWERDAGSESR